MTGNKRADTQTKARLGLPTGRQAAGGDQMAEKFYMIPSSIAGRQDLRGSDKMVYAAIVDRIRGNGVASRGTRRIAQDAGLARNTVKASLRHLEALGLLVVEPGRGGETNHYRLGLPACPVGRLWSLVTRSSER